ncbi:hydrogenase maturation nickel metallochaperone HypA [Enorma burkinafasonensis]|uniref:hydrogenase maturation nickel metallochaperone HypA/HybF n=1 Tax=Enorma burkinafasonensis TaxID=2590867 RepID=UPI0026F2C25B|nr:hydrogenase maturation nickel metallochaperone HypA [Enorma burkinafasonensis]MCI7730121.1 hydrogenase maturation nickel metallochaperone HypA [Enorma burkinafasonensis]
MHELGLVSGILETVTAAAREAGALRVVSVTLRIGDLREVVPESLDFAWEVLGEEDPLTAGSELVVEEVHPRSRCLACGAEFDHDRFHLRCPVCGSAATTLLAGRELQIVSMEVDLP